MNKEDESKTQTRREQLLPHGVAASNTTKAMIACLPFAVFERCALDAIRCVATLIVALGKSVLASLAVYVFEILQDRSH
jgi:hypothetical protein